jgi:hypothetical protein
MDADLPSIYLLESCLKIYELCRVNLFMHAKLLYNNNNNNNNNNIHTPMRQHLEYTCFYWYTGTPHV